MSLTEVPYEVLQHALSYLPWYEMAVVNQVSKRFRRISGKKLSVLPREMAYVSVGRLNWARFCGLKLTRRSTLECVEIGNLEVLRKLIYECGTWSAFDLIVRAVVAGHLHVVRALRDESLGLTATLHADLTMLASKHGHIEILRALRDGTLGARCPWDKFRCRVNGFCHPKIVELIVSGELD